MNLVGGTAFWHNKRVLISGHCGFIGANVLADLLDRGALPVGYDRVLSSPSLKVLGVDCPSVVGDVLDLAGLERGIRDLRPEVVVHLAGCSHIKGSQEFPYQAFQANAMGTVTVLEAVRRAAPTAAVVCASSNHVFAGGLCGDNRRFGEDDQLGATDVYGSSKICADVAVRCYRESYGLRAAALRHTNSFGGADPHASHLVTGSVLSCLKGEPPTLRSDGSAVRAYTHVSNIVAGYLFVAEHVDELAGHAVNLTEADGELSALQMARLVMELACVSGKPTLLGTDLTQAGYVERLDDSHLRALGWRQATSLRAGLNATLTWYRERGGMAWATL